ncbi:MAG TPA: TPM domain-containing protein [Bacillota bacterium]|nr:TPM domain-containing protein [Bacillota bacterium]
MRARQFLNQLQQAEIVAAIREAEQRTSGEIRVFVSRRDIEDPLAAARRHFAALGMEKTRERNGVLIFVAPRTQQFAILGDSGIHTRCGENFWTQLAAQMSAYFQRAEFTQGIVYGVKTAGELLAQHFPFSPDDQNELPNDIAHD